MQASAPGDRVLVDSDLQASGAADGLVSGALLARLLPEKLAQAAQHLRAVQAAVQAQSVAVHSSCAMTVALFRSMAALLGQLH